MKGCINGGNVIRLLFLSAKLLKFEIQKCNQILCAHKPYFLMPGHISRNSTGTSPACAIVTGAAALVLEKYPHFTPAQVKKYLIDEATDGAIDMSIIIRGDRINKLLYVGNGT